MKPTPQGKRFREITRPLIIAQFAGCEIVRGKIKPRIVAEGDERWSDFVIDRFENTVRNPKAFDEYKKVRKRTVFEWVYERHLQDLALMKMPLDNKEDRRRFDKAVYDLIEFRGRSILAPNSFTISATRAHGQQTGIRFLGKTESAKVKPPPFKFSVKIEMVLANMEL